MKIIGIINLGLRNVIKSYFRTLIYMPGFQNVVKDYVGIFTLILIHSIHSFLTLPFM